MIEKRDWLPVDQPEGSLLDLAWNACLCSHSIALKLATSRANCHRVRSRCQINKQHDDATSGEFRHRRINANRWMQNFVTAHITGIDKNRTSGHLFNHQLLEAIQYQAANTRRYHSLKTRATTRSGAVQAKTDRPGQGLAVPNRTRTTQSALPRRDNENHQPSGNQFSTPDPGESLCPPPGLRA
jgi:hypothetical protein